MVEVTALLTLEFAQGPAGLHRQNLLKRCDGVVDGHSIISKPEHCLCRPRSIRPGGFHYWV